MAAESEPFSHEAWKQRVEEGKRAAAAREVIARCDAGVARAGATLEANDIAVERNNKKLQESDEKFDEAVSDLSRGAGILRD